MLLGPSRNGNSTGVGVSGTTDPTNGSRRGEGLWEVNSHVSHNISSPNTQRPYYYSTPRFKFEPTTEGSCSSYSGWSPFGIKSKDIRGRRQIPKLPQWLGEPGRSRSYKISLLLASQVPCLSPVEITFWIWNGEKWCLIIGATPTQKLTADSGILRVVPSNNRSSPATSKVIRSLTSTNIIRLLPCRRRVRTTMPILTTVIQPFPCRLLRHDQFRWVPMRTAWPRPAADISCRSTQLAARHSTNPVTQPTESNRIQTVKISATFSSNVNKCLPSKR